MLYEESPAPASLQPFVRHFWLVRAQPQERYEKILPGPSAHLVLNLSAPYRLIDPDAGGAAEVPTGFYAGLQRRYLISENPRSSSMSGSLRAFGLAAFTGSFLLALVMALVLAAFIGRAGAAFGTFAGLAAGVGWVATALGVSYLFERRSLALFAINGGYNVVTFTAMGAIIGSLQWPGHCSSLGRASRRSPPNVPEGSVAAAALRPDGPRVPRPTGTGPRPC